MVRRSNVFIAGSSGAEQWVHMSVTHGPLLRRPPDDPAPLPVQRRIVRRLWKKQAREPNGYFGHLGLFIPHWLAISCVLELPEAIGLYSTHIQEL